MPSLLPHLSFFVITMGNHEQAANGWIDGSHSFVKQWTMRANWHDLVCPRFEFIFLVIIVS
jgi:hypothetical protein